LLLVFARFLHLSGIISLYSAPNLSVVLTTLLYIDPGSGSYLAQVIAAAVLGIVFFFKNLRLVIQDFFRRLFKKNKDSRDGHHQEEK
jgi:hypothetical protein